MVDRSRSKCATSAVVAELEGTLLKDPDLFPYFMLVAFEASGLVRFALLLFLWPLIRLLGLLGFPGAALRVMVFVAVAGVKVSEIEAVARAVLPKFLMEDVDQAAWGKFRSNDRRAVVTRCPRVMVESFLREHLAAGDVIGPEIEVNRFGYATGILLSGAPVRDAVTHIFGNERPDMGLGRRQQEVAPHESFLSLCQEQRHPPFDVGDNEGESIPPAPVIFHDGRLVPRPTPFTSLLIILWVPLGVVVAAIRIVAGIILPFWFLRSTARFFGGDVIVRGYPPPPPVSGSRSGVLFVCNHRTLLDPVALAMVLRRKVPAVTYSISRLSEILSPIPTIRLSRDRQTDADRIQMELSRGDLVVCPEGTTCREPFLLRFSALFAELTDRIVPVAMNYRVGFFHATTARGWKGMDPIFFFMNPRPIYEVTFLNQLPADATCGAGRSPHDVANYVQRMLASTLGFECTNFTRRDKYRVLAGNDGTVTAAATRFAKPGLRWAREMLVGFLLLGILSNF